MSITENLELLNRDFRSFDTDFKISKSTQFILDFLVKDFVTYSQYVIPSVKYLEDHLEPSISVRTIKRVIRTLVDLKILQKRPRSTTQPLVLDINNCLLRFILAINQPKFDLPKQLQSQLNEELNDSFLQQLITCRKHIESLIDSLTNKHATVQELCEYFLDSFPASSIIGCPPVELEVYMKESLEWFVGEELLSLPKQLEELLVTKEVSNDNSDL